MGLLRIEELEAVATSFDLLKTPIIIVAATSDLPDPGSIATDLVWAV